MRSDRYRLPRLTFAAIDCETATDDVLSVCAVAVVRVVEGVIRCVRRWIVRPEPMPTQFSYSALHGIMHADVVDRPPLSAVASDLARAASDAAFVAAHHARFDVRLLEAAGIRRSIVAGRPVLCTARLARVWLRRRRTALPSCCEALSIPLRHHDPRSDAVACARIVMSAAATSRGRRAIAGLLAAKGARS